MITVAIISEYNPFHTGHKHHIDKIREEFGDDCTIVAIMSGNYTQRGEVAIADKTLRAKLAVINGINLVLEIPFPFSISSAEFFAKSGVKIADSLGNIDYISFGSECGDINKIKKAANVLNSLEFKDIFLKLSSDENKGYPKLCEDAYKVLCPDDSFSFTANNILAIEYIRALNSCNSDIKPHTVMRSGAGYNDSQIGSFSHQSAMAIREKIRDLDFSALNYIPNIENNTLISLLQSGEIPTDINKISTALISFFRLNPPLENSDIQDANDGLYNRLHNLSFGANDISSLLELSETKRYTKARIRRAMLNSYFGVTSSEVKKLPHYTQVLAMDKKGMLVLKTVRKQEEFKILTKPSDYKNFNDVQMHQKLLSDKADSIFELTKPAPVPKRTWLTFTPFIKK